MAPHNDTVAESPSGTIPKKWQADHIPDQHGRIAVVTGGNTGLGYETALELARHGAHVVLACRSTAKGAAAAAAIMGDTSAAQVEVAELDLADLGSVRKCAAHIADRHERIDLLINNAGVMATPRRTTADGFELQLGTNHFGHFALTGLLLPQLLASRAPRVVTLSSTLHSHGKIRFDDLNRDRGYNRYLAYGQAKLANLLFARELDRMARRAGTDLVSLAAHPGYAATNLQLAGIGFAPLRALMGGVNRMCALSPRMGALPTLCAATQPGVPGGSFVGPGKLGGYRGFPGFSKSSGRARDEETAVRLWHVSEQLTEVRYRFPTR